MLSARDRGRHALCAEEGRRQRGGLASRAALARGLGCGCIEMPCDFIKNSGEVERTGVEMGAPLTPAAVAELYDGGTGPAPLPYILHTEPSLPRMDGCGLRMQAALRWHDRVWTNTMVSMIVGVAERLGAPPAAVEIHPGDLRNGNDHLIGGMIAIRDAFEERFGVLPAVLLENRTGQFVQDGDSMKRFWETLALNEPDLAGDCGIVLDVQQLFTVTKTRFLANLAAIPTDSLRAFHIHAKHRAPALDDPIPWRAVFSLIGRIERPVLINPEVHHIGQAGATIEFCRAMLAPGAGKAGPGSHS